MNKMCNVKSKKILKINEYVTNTCIILTSGLFKVIQGRIYKYHLWSYASTDWTAKM
jgi:hypothetical protein